MEVTHQDAPEVNTFQKNRAGLLSEQPDGSLVGLTVGEAVPERATRQTAMVRGKELTLREAYDRYKANKGIGRADMIGLMIEAIEALQDRIGAVDEAAVAALTHRVTSLETVIGNALRLSVVRAADLPDQAAALGEQSKRGPGRPRTVKTEAGNG